MLAPSCTSLQLFQETLRAVTRSAATLTWGGQAGWRGVKVRRWSKGSDGGRGGEAFFSAEKRRGISQWRQATGYQGEASREGGVLCKRRQLVLLSEGESRRGLDTTDKHLFRCPFIKKKKQRRERERETPPFSPSIIFSTVPHSALLILWWEMWKPPLPLLPIHHAHSAGQDTPSHGSLLSTPPIAMLGAPLRPPPHHAPIYHKIFGASSLARIYREKNTPVTHRRFTLTLRGHCTQSLRSSFVLFFYPLPPPPPLSCRVMYSPKTLGALPFVESFALRAADGSSWNHENVLSNKGFLNPNQKKSGDLSLLGASVRNTPPHPLRSLPPQAASCLCVFSSSVAMMSVKY